jgi:mRNA-degrading endonuclease RelE of RelBE toxin-antitoxin system
MKIIETPIFTKKVKKFLSEEEYRNLQNELVTNPEKGKVIPGSAGLRKIRWGISGKGKSGGVRIIYYWISRNDTILMLMIYPKSEQVNLTEPQLRILKSLVEKELQCEINYSKN